MFERYTERARRVIFFARYEASQSGSLTIETEHLLLGVLRENPHITRFLDFSFSAANIRELLQARLTKREKVSTGLDLPLSDENKRILAHAAEEGERLNHRHIGTEHLLLGILREEKCGAATVLRDIGFDLTSVRDQLSRYVGPPEPGDKAEATQTLREMVTETTVQDVTLHSVVVPNAEVAERTAEAAWKPIFGEVFIESQKPLASEQRFNVWIVSGTAPPEKTLYAFISKKTGKILALGRGVAAGT
jgi:ATP-dependent Clp protease ATP-binding subunit ClpA